MTEKEFDKKWSPVYKERIKKSHNESAPETKLKLQALEINQQNIVDKIDAIIDTLEKVEDKLDAVIEKKADKDEIDRLTQVIEKKANCEIITQIQTEIEKIKDKIENRNYEWLKYIITAIIGGLIVVAIKFI